MSIRRIRAAARSVEGISQGPLLGDRSNSIWKSVQAARQRYRRRKVNDECKDMSSRPINRPGRKTVTGDVVRCRPMSSQWGWTVVWQQATSLGSGKWNIARNVSTCSVSLMESFNISQALAIDFSSSGQRRLNPNPCQAVWCVLQDALLRPVMSIG